MKRRELPADWAHLTRDKRNRLGWTQQELGEYLGGVHFVTVANWEAGRKTPRGLYRERLALWLVVEFPTLFDLPERMRKNDRRARGGV